MTKYLFIETRSGFEMHDDASLNDVVEGVRARNHAVTVFLVQNAVLDARAGAKHNERLAALSRSGVEILADAFSLRERAIVEWTVTIDSGVFVVLDRSTSTSLAWVACCIGGCSA